MRIVFGVYNNAISIHFWSKLKPVMEHMNVNCAHVPNMLGSLNIASYLVYMPIVSLDQTFKVEMKTMQLFF